MNTAYLGLGANLGDPVQQIIDARQQLSTVNQGYQSRCSSLYVTSPIGYAEQKDFVNCVLELKGDVAVRELFSAMQAIESSLGRVRDSSNQNAPRKIDIDLLVFGQHQINDVDLVVPHPRISQRLFVLVPLMELNPQLSIAGQGVVSELVQNEDLLDQKIFKLGA